MNKKPLPILAITPGDPEGIGPEIVEKVLKNPRFYRGRFVPLVVGDAEPFRRSKLNLRKITLPMSGNSSLFSAGTKEAIPFLAPPSSRKGKQLLPGWVSGWAVKSAAALCLMKVTDALITGPIDKARLQKGGFPYFGHTDLLADVCGVPEVTMMLANDRLRVSLATIHQSVKSISGSLTVKSIHHSLLQTKVALQKDFGIRRPRIAVLGLNPHCGEKGLMGQEEIKTIVPALKAFEKKHSDVSLSGPFPADTFFAIHYGNKDTAKAFDAVLAMYHDQGLIPVKMIDFDRTVNLTLGLPIIRTSVDHGTAFDIAGKGIANPASLEAAIEMALQMVKNRS